MCGQCRVDFLLLTPYSSTIIISHPDTSYVITTLTSDADIQKIPKKDCKILLQTYAVSQGFSNLRAQIESMLVSPLRADLIKARDQLLLTPQHQDHVNHDDPKVDIPFVLTHDTTDAEIQEATASALQEELQTMWIERKSYDSIMWDSLNIPELQKMAIEERDAIKACFSNFKKTDTKQTKDGHEVITIADNDEDEYSDEDETMEDVDDEIEDGDDNEAD